MLCTSVLVSVVFAFTVNLGLDLWQVGGNSRRLVRHAISEELPLFLLGSFIVWLFVVLLVALLGRLWLSLGLIVTATLILGFANHRKQQLLTEPLYPSDLVFAADPAFLTAMVGWRPVAVLLTGSAVVIVLSILTGRLLGRWFPRPERPRLLAFRLVVAVTCVAALANVVQFHDPGNVVKAMYDKHGAHWTPWHQRGNYIDNGFVAGMLYNLPIPAMRRPPGYGPETMREVTATYSSVADRINRRRQPAALDDVNVVFLLNEAFSDPLRIKAAELAQDPIPYTRSVMRRTTSGSMWSQKYGGGTANVEFEALTGMSLALFRPQMNTPFQMLVPDQPTFPSGVHVLEEHGLESLAMHSFTSALYRRSEVYPILGFDDADFQDEFVHTDTLEDNGYVSDAATYAEVLNRLEESEQPMFLNTVTMQNHYPMAGKYADPIASSGLPDTARTENLEHYARGLRYSDAALRTLIEALAASEEKTIVVFYGDHLPSVWPPAQLSRRARHQTPFFVYANFGRPEVERLSTTSPIHFMNHVLDVADARVPPYYALLHQLERELPAMGHDMLIGPDNRRLARSELSSRAQRLLHDYRLVQYDLAIGERYSAEALLDTDTHPARPPQPGPAPD